MEKIDTNNNSSNDRYRNRNQYLWICVYLELFSIFYFCPLRGPKSNNTRVAASTYGNRHSLEKWGPGQEYYNKTGTFFELENKEVLKE